MSVNPHVITAQRLPELMELVEIYKGLRPMKVLEIGSEYGGTLWWWLHEAQPGGKIANIDMMMAESMGFDLQLAWRSWAPPGVELRTFAGSSHDMDLQEQVMEWFGWELDFLFIDGDHTLKGATRDWELYGQYAKVTAFHDLIPSKPHVEVNRLFEELKEKGLEHKEIYSEKDQAWGGIGVIYGH